jgi:prepilin-type N-terminal cleavage/methylation domain-containing protein
MIRRQMRGAFSLVEILIVVMIIGILAAIAVPKFSNASQIARENSLKDNLRLLRTQLGVYKTQHSVFPGYPAGDSNQTPTAAIAADQLMKYTDAVGNISDTGTSLYKWGPYLDQIPTNPINSKADIKILSSGDALVADGTTGWLYQPSTGTIRANVAGNDGAGHPVIDY